MVRWPNPRTQKSSPRSRAKKSATAGARVIRVCMKGGGRCLVRATTGGGSWVMPSSSISSAVNQSAGCRVPLHICWAPTGCTLPGHGGEPCVAWWRSWRKFSYHEWSRVHGEDNICVLSIAFWL